MNVWEIHEDILKQLEGMEKSIRAKSGEQIEDPIASAHNRGLLLSTVTIRMELARVFKAFRDEPELTPEEKSKHEEVDGLLGADENLRNKNPRDERKQ